MMSDGAMRKLLSVVVAAALVGGTLLLRLPSLVVSAIAGFAAVVVLMRIGFFRSCPAAD